MFTVDAVFMLLHGSLATNRKKNGAPKMQVRATLNESATPNEQATPTHPDNEIQRLELTRYAMA